MLRLDPSILPDPFKPEANDAYGLAPSMSQLVVISAFETNAGAHQVHFVVRGDFKICDVSLFAPMLVSLGFIPTGRMTSEPLPAAPVGPRIEPGEAFHAYVEPGSFHEGVLVGRREALDPVDGGLMENEHRALARRFGPMLRLAREKHRVKLGDLARALGCQTAALSAFELGERPGDPQPLGTDAMDPSARKRSHHDIGGEALLRPPAGEMVGSLTGQNTSWYTAHKEGYVDANGADYFVEAGEVYRLKDGRFEYAHGASAIATIDPSETIHPADNVATETARNILVDLMTPAVMAVYSPNKHILRMGVNEADVQVALHDALNKPEARAAMRLHEPGPDPAKLASWIANSLGFEFVLWRQDATGYITAFTPQVTDCIRRAIETAPPAAGAVASHVEVDITARVQAGQVAEAVRVLGLIDGKDQQHDGEALQQALAILRQVAP